MDRAGAEPQDPAWQVTEQQVREFDPHWAVFWGDGIVASQLETWLPYLRRSQYRYLIMSGIDEANAGVARLVEGVPNLMVAMPYESVRGWLKRCRRHRGVIYPTTRSANFGMVTAYQRRSHVWIGHGESEKGVNGPRTASLYDSVFMARYDALDRFPRTIRSWVRGGACAIGSPIVEGVLRDPWSAPRPVRTIVYAPTWEGRRPGANYSSLPEVRPALVELLPRLLERGVTVILRPHPGTGKREPEYLDHVDALYAAGARRPGPKPDDFAAADLMISDVSGVTAEFLFTEKPLIIPVTSNATARGKEESTLAREYPWAYQWNVRREDLLAKIDGLGTSDPLRDRRRSGAAAMYRGHHTIDEAARTFDTALSCVNRRGSRIPVRLAFEAKMRLRPLLGRLRRGGGPKQARRAS